MSKPTAGARRRGQARAGSRKNVPELIVFVGLQGSGKSTFYTTRLSKYYGVVSKDLLRGKRNKEAQQRQLVAEALQKGQSLVVDNTNPSRQTRAPLIEIAKACKARLVAFYFQTTIPKALERNARREGKARVPDVAIHATATKLEAPDYDEGFDDIYVVRFREPFFLVERQPPAVAPRVQNPA